MFTPGSVLNLSTDTAINKQTESGPLISALKVEKRASSSSLSAELHSHRPLYHVSCNPDFSPDLMTGTKQEQKAQNATSCRFPRYVNFSGEEHVEMIETLLDPIHQN